MTITELSIKRPSLVIIVFAALAVLGIICYNQLPYELMPKMSPPIVTVVTMYYGASPEEIESNVTKVIEDAVSGIEKIDKVTSISQEGVSMVTIQFKFSTIIDYSLQDVQRKVNAIVNQLPSDAGTPVVSKLSMDEMAVVQLGATSTMPPTMFYTFLKNIVKPELSRIAGVAQINLIGGEEREVKVNLNRAKLRACGLSIAGVTQSIRNSNLEYPAGTVKDRDASYSVRVAGKIDDLGKLRHLVVGMSPVGVPVHLTDVADVTDGIKDITQKSRINGVPSVGIQIMKQSDANTVSVSRLVRQRLAWLERTYSANGLKFSVAQDASIFTISAADAVKHDIVVAVMLVALVMLLFLHSIRNSVIVLVAIPTSMVCTFIALYVLGFTLNMMSLLGLALVVGILVDDSIVVLENIHRFIEHGHAPPDAALRGRNEIGFAALAITFVDVAVFLPLSLVSGMIGNVLRQFATVIVVSTLMSLMVSFTVTPMLASRFMKLEHITARTVVGRFVGWFERIFQRLIEWYAKTLEWALGHHRQVIGVSLALFVGSLAMMPLGLVGGEFMPEADRGEFTVTVEMPAGTKIEQTNEMTARIEKLIAQAPEVMKIAASVGTASGMMMSKTTTSTNAEISVSLLPKNQRDRTQTAIIEDVRSRLRDLPGVTVRVSPVNMFGTANNSPIQLMVIGPRSDAVLEAAGMVKDAVRRTPSTKDIYLSSEQGKPEVRVEIDREKMSRLGLSLADVASTIRVALTGDDNTKYREAGEDYTTRIILDESDRSSTADVGNILFVNQSGAQVMLKQFATAVRATGPTKLERYNRNSTVTVNASFSGRFIGAVTDDIMSRLRSLKLPNGVAVLFGGDVERQNESFSSLGMALLAAIVFVYMVMVALYDSFIDPFIVLFSVPVAAVGALTALAASHRSLNTFSIIGMVMLVGLVSKNAILLVDRTKQMRSEQKMPIRDALVEAGKTRLRPILMTTLTMVFGMLPVAMATNPGAEMKSGLAWAIVGGLTSSLLLTLVLVPVVYLQVDHYTAAVPVKVQTARIRAKRYLGIAVTVVRGMVQRLQG
jgi:HAE1 family hydrophobic/amphiphilic exporter-1